MPAPAPSLPLAGDRFVSQGLLGRGGFGSVHDVLDRQTGMRVALKLLDRQHGRALARFKTEFRTLTDLHHPNLVRLYELHHESKTGQWFFTMERVLGVDPLAALALKPGLGAKTEEGKGAAGARVTGTRTGTATGTGGSSESMWFAGGHHDWVADAPPSPLRPAEPTKIRALFAQVAIGVAALHDAGIVHRDLKPSNILVDDEGRVKILDFGLISLLDSDHDHRRLAGTPAYIAPELLAGEAVSPASDWYAFGVMLHQALTGRLPPLDRHEGLLADERGNLPELCRALLAHDPAERPRAREILASFELEPGTRQLRQQTFVGREEQLEQLFELFGRSRTQPAMAWILGASGVGKSALARELLGRLEHGHGAVIASARCYEQDKLPLAALDGMVDALGLALLGAELELELDEDLRDALLQLFPTLSLALGDRRERGADELRDPKVLRHRASMGLEQILAAIAREHPLVLHIDDLQWGDAASGAMLSRLLEADIPLLLVGTCRLEERAQAEFITPLDALGEHVARRELPLEPLDAAARRRLVSALLDPDEADPQLVASIAAESEGNPFFIEELVRHREARIQTGASLRELVSRRLATLAPAERALLERVAVASQPVPRELVFPSGAAPAAGGPASWEALDRLRGMQLVRVRAPDGDQAQLESYHDRIREAVLGEIAGADRLRYNLELAEAMDAAAFDDRGRIARHFVAANEGPRAVPHALAAADQARSSLAFERAIALMGLALDHLEPGSPRALEVREQQADVCVLAGRLLEAGESYEALASTHTRPEAMLRQASEQYMTAGQIDRGTAIMRGLIEGRGLRWPASEGRALLGVLAQAARLGVRGVAFDETARPEPERLALVDLCYSAQRGLASVDFARGAYYQMLGTRLALDGGDRERAILALSASSQSLRGIGLKLGDRARAEAGRLLGDAQDSFEAGHLGLLDGFGAIIVGEYADSLEILSQAIPLLEAQREVSTIWELSIGRAMREDCLYMLGDYASLATLAPESRTRAEALGDLTSAFTAGLYYGILQLALGRPKRAKSTLLEVVEGLSSNFSYGWPHTMSIAMLLACDLYMGNLVDAWRHFEAEWPRFRRSPFYRTKGTRGRVCSGVTSLIWQLLDDGPTTFGLPSRAEALRLARRLIRTLRRAGLVWARAEAAFGEAVLAVQAKDFERARTWLEQAERGYEAKGMRLRATYARARMAQLDGNGAGFAHALEAIGAAGIVDPQRWLDAHAGGFRHVPRPAL